VNDRREDGPIARYGPKAGPTGNWLSNDIRKAMADHRRTLVGPSDYVQKHGGRYGQELPGKRTVQLQDGTVIETWVNPYGLVPSLKARVYYPGSVRTVLYEAILFLESGLIELPNTAAAKDPTIPVMLFPMSQQRSLVSLDKHQLLDEYKLGGRKASGTDGEFVYRDYLQQTLVSESLSAEVAAYRKLLAIDLATWELTGKLALLVQTQILGRQDCTYSDVVYFVDAARRGINGRNPESAQQSYWLYTVRLGFYVLVLINGAEVLIRPIRVDPAYNDALTAITKTIEKNNFAETSAIYRRYEAYILSVCKFSMPEWTAIANITIKGSSLYYGWKPTWRGIEASIVTHVNMGIEVGGAVPIEARLYTIKLSENILFTETEDMSSENLPFVFNFREIEYNRWTPIFGTNALWIPSTQGSHTSSFWKPKPCGVPWKTEINCSNAPVYCWYDADNKLTVVRYSRTVNYTPPPTFPSQIEWQLSWGCWASNSGSFTAPNYNTYLPGSRSSFSISKSSSSESGGFEYPGANGSGISSAEVGGITTAQINEYSYSWNGGSHNPPSNWEGENSYPSQCVSLTYYIASSNICPMTGDANPTWVNWEPSDPAISGCPTNYARVVPLGQRTNSYSRFRQGSLSTSTAVVVAGGNAESAFLAEVEQLNASSGYNSDYTANRNTADMDVYTERLNYAMLYYYNVYGNGPSGNVDYQDPIALPSYISSTAWNPTLRYTVTFYYFDKWSGEQIYSGTSEDVPELAEIPNGLTAFFGPAACEDTYDPGAFTGHFFTRAGIEGYKFHLKTPGSLSYLEFGSNFEIDYTPQPAQVFAGWQ
jgi:hypothetical protein